MTKPKENMFKKTMVKALIILYTRKRTYFTTENAVSIDIDSVEMILHKEVRKSLWIDHNNMG